jgi:RNA polymerase sigma-70 factor (ECF subfamily)
MPAVFLDGGGGMMENGETVRYRGWIDRLRHGDGSALNEILTHFEARLIHLTHLMLARFPGVRRWEQTGDVFQEAMLRLQRALAVASPESPRRFLQLAALQVRRELLSMAKYYEFRASPSRAGVVGNGSSGEPMEPSSDTDGPFDLSAWTEFHEKADGLDDDLRAAFDLLWYDGLTQEQAAAVLNVSERTVRDRWQKARRALLRELGGQLPGS